MKRLPVTKLTDQELDLMIEDGRFNYGGEAIVCHGNNPNTCFKLFHMPGATCVTYMSDNKEQKLTKLYNHPIPGLLVPISLVSNRRNIIGYEMPYSSTCDSILDTILTPEERLSCLYQTKAILERLPYYECVYGDLKSDNVLYDQKTGKVVFCDVDNIQLGPYKMDIYGTGVDTYMRATGRIDEKTDVFSHNLFTLEQLFYRDESFGEIMTHIYQMDIQHRLQDARAREIINSMRYPETFKGEYVLEYTKKRS